MNDEDGIDWGKGRVWTEEDHNRATAELVKRYKAKRRQENIQLLWVLAMCAVTLLAVWLWT